MQHKKFGQHFILKNYHIQILMNSFDLSINYVNNELWGNLGVTVLN
jgi:hypothetical protein